MQLSAGKLAVALLAAFAFAGTLTLPAQGAIPFAACHETNDFACAHLSVPLDPGGATPGTITLALRRHRAPVEGSNSAVIALAGGPGQAAIPFAESFAELLGPIISTRDLIVFDQRGTGDSHPLSCHAFEGSGGDRSPAQQVATCAAQIGATRAFYTTADSVADIEAIRQAGGYEKLVLYGTSYGTKVAEQYAQDYPSHVEALVLDSVVPPNGPDVLHTATFAAIPRILRQLCGYGVCAHITREPVADLAQLVNRMERGHVRGRVIGGDGRAHTVSANSDDLLNLLLQGDFSPLLRAELITAIRAADGGDTAVLARILAAAESTGESPEEGSDNPLFFATTCEEQVFPWSRAVSAGARVAQVKSAIEALPKTTIAPFTAANVFDFGDFAECASWPFSGAAPVLDEAPLPNVPTLILSGASDLRTPTANAQAVAAQIPDSHLLVVPYAGHSVLTDEPTACAREALLAQFAGKPIQPCRAMPPPAVLRPPPLPPLRLAEVSPVEGFKGQLGRTLHAVRLTFDDFDRQLEQQLVAALSAESSSALSSLRSGGLRAGWVRFGKGAFTFHGYSYVPGVTISGTVKAEAVNLRIGGSAAAHGTLRLAAHHELVGSLGGRRVHLQRRTGATAAIVDADAQASPYFGVGGAAARAAGARELLALLRLLDA